MAINLASLRRGGERKPPRILIYGTHGIGKTSIAAGAEAPVFLQTEDGLGMLDAPTFGLLRTFDEVMQAITALYTEPHEFKTVILDTLDWLEPMVWAEASRINGWQNIEQPGYGKGYIAAMDVWRQLLEGLNALRDDKGMAIIMLAHCDIKKFESPESEPYDRYIIKLQARASSLIQEHVDCLLFANYRVSIVRDKITPIGKKEDGRARAIGGGGRVIYAEERPAFLAKNRFSMPAQIAMPDVASQMWPAIAQHIPFYQTPTTTQTATQQDAA